MRKAFKIAGIGCGILLLLAAGLVAWLDWELRPQPADSALPPLARGLAADFAQGDRQFHDRITQRFALASPQAELAAALKHQGFSFHGTLASFRQQRFPCTLYWVVFWQADAAGRIQKLETRYSPSCL